jgi:hypothetical protein
VFNIFANPQETQKSVNKNYSPIPTMPSSKLEKQLIDTYNKYHIRALPKFDYDNFIETIKSTEGAAKIEHIIKNISDFPTQHAPVLCLSPD